MTYKETLDFLFSILPMYQRVGKTAYKKDLSNTLALLEELDNPHKKFKSIHIAGTNGKGTSAHALAAILQLSGYRTGLYTSPHLVSFTERIKINGVEVEEDFVVRFVEKAKDTIERIEPSFFEVTVAMSFTYFAENQVDIAVIETGLGGRLDSTNVIDPEVSLITNIGWDHIDLLGDTLVQIAGEKAGIIKEQTPVVLGSYQQEVIDVFRAKAQSIGAPLVVADDEQSSLFTEKDPYHKRANEQGIVSTVVELVKKGWNISEQNIEEGLLNFEKITGLKGRYQLLEESPQLIVDVSHNEDGIKNLFDQVQSTLNDKLHIVFGTVQGRDLNSIFRLFPKNASFYWTQSHVPRSLSVEQLAEQAGLFGLSGASFEDVNAAIKQAKSSAGTNDCIVVMGSTFVVAEVDGL